MVSTLLKPALREIRQSLGRYLAILAIIGLGVGFFAGLRMAQPSMIATGADYLDQLHFHDFRLLSTLGFTDEDVQAFSAHDGVERAAGSVYTEFLWQRTDDEAALIAHMLTPGINEPNLIAGRMPAAANECLGDALYFTEADLGRELPVSENNDEDTLDLLACDSYTLVGLVNSPLYLNFERGTASIGSGSLNAFVLLPEEGFDTEVYHEIYLHLSDSAAAWSDAYETQIDEKTPGIEALLTERAQLRYDTLYSDAMDEIRDAEQELADGWAEYRTERADAEAELADAYKELTEGEQSYQDGLAEYEQGKLDYEDGLKKYNDGLRELSDAKLQLDDAKAELDSAKTQLDEGEASYSQLQGLYSSAARMAQAMGFAAPEELITVLNSGTQSQLNAAVDQALAAQGSSLQAFLGGWAAAEESLGGSLDEARLNALRVELNTARDLYEQGLADYDAGLAEYEDGLKEMEEARLELDDAKAELDSAPAELADARAELDDGWAEYYDGLAEAEAEFADAEQKLADGEEEIADAYLQLEDLKLPDTYTLTRSENVGYACFQNDTSIVQAISVVFPVFFFLVAALVCMTTMKRMVDEQRTQIGVLKALGYGNGQIISKYLFYSGSAALIGGVAGYALGGWGLPVVIWEIYGIMYGFAPLLFVFDPVLAVICFAAALVCSMGATYLSCRVELTRSAAELIRPKTPKAGKRVFLEYITPIWKRLSFLRKVSVRNVLRYRSRLIMMLLGIGGCTALLVTGFGLRDSLGAIVDSQYDEITLFDYEVSFRDAQTLQQAEDYLTSLGWAAEDGLLVHSGSTDVMAEDAAKDAFLVVPAEARLDGFIDLHEGERAIPFPGVGEAVLNYGLAEDLQLNVGDTIRLRSEDTGSIEVVISDICDNYIYDYVFVSPETYHQQLSLTPAYKTLFILAHPDADPYSESVLLASVEDVSTVSVSDATRTRINSMLSRLDLLVIVVVLCAAALAFIVLYNLTNINITERVREIATIKVLGFFQREVASYVFREIMMLSAAGSLIGLAMGYGLHAFVMDQVQVDGMFFPRQIFPWSYLICVVLTMLFTVLITNAMRPKLNKIDMAESLKSIE